MATKAQMLKAIESLPDDPTIDDAIERLGIIRLILCGVAAGESGRVISQDEVERLVAEKRE